MAKCEDYPCCGHTPTDPCGPQWYDQPSAFDTSIPGNEHALCDHENGECDVPEDEDEDDDDDEEPEDDGTGYAGRHRSDDGADAAMRLRILSWNNS